MLTGVAFTFAACYAPTYSPDWNEPEYRRDQDQTEQQIQAAYVQVAEQTENE